MIKSRRNYCSITIPTRCSSSQNCYVVLQKSLKSNSQQMLLTICRNKQSIKYLYCYHVRIITVSVKVTNNRKVRKKVRTSHSFNFKKTFSTRFKNSYCFMFLFWWRLPCGNSRLDFPLNAYSIVVVVGTVVEWPIDVGITRRCYSPNRDRFFLFSWMRKMIIVTHTMIMTMPFLQINSCNVLQSYTFSIPVVVDWQCWNCLSSTWVCIDGLAKLSLYYREVNIDHVHYVINTFNHTNYR